jgi:hypothetical protein
MLNLETDREDGFLAGRGVFKQLAAKECNFCKGRSLISAFVGTGRKEFVFSYFDIGYNSD